MPGEVLLFKVAASSAVCRESQPFSKIHWENKGHMVGAGAGWRHGDNVARTRKLPGTTDHFPLGSQITTVLLAALVASASAFQAGVMPSTR